MKKTLLTVIILSGLSALHAKSTKEYHLVKTLKSWADAQTYCRENFTDLAAVAYKNNPERWLSVLRETGGQNTTWTGRFWREKWLLGNADFNNNTDFSNWERDEPNWHISKHTCTVMTEEGLWISKGCSKKYPVVCYYGKGPSTYILVKAEMSWYMAKRYCQENYTDIASVRSMSENNNISMLLDKHTWIGLHTQAQWSHKTRLSLNESPHNLPHSCTAVSAETGKWLDLKCEEKHYFICQHISHPPPKTSLRLSLKFRSKADLNDPASQQQILQQLHSKMEKYGISDFKLRWMEMDEQVFHKDQKRKEEEGAH